MIEPGDYLISGTPIARVSDSSKLTVQKYISFADVCTPNQDIRYALEQSIDMIIRALSPSMSDPYTVINAMHGLSAGLALLIDKDDREIGLCDEQNKIRVITKITDIDQMIKTMYRTMRGDVASSIDASLSLIDMTKSLLYGHAHNQYASLLIDEIKQSGFCIERSSLDVSSKRDAAIRIAQFVATHDR